MKYTTDMKIDVLTLFPNMFKGPFEESMIKRAQEKGAVEINFHDLRDWGQTERKIVDDRPYSGGPGMLLKVEVIDNALKDIKKKSKGRVILLDATGEKYTQAKAKEYSQLDNIILIAGHYEGIDHRVHEHLVDEVISIGDYVLTGGEIPIMVVVDSVVRLLPGVLGKDESSVDESHSTEGYLEYPQYTRPEDYKGWKVPKVLLSGNHKEIDKWRKGE
ncbi:MAG: tRNA (guanosine(37)-N1)-methyltransferase TrmD [Microgenomates group bacterium]